MTIATGAQALAADILKAHNASGYLDLATSTELTIAAGAVTNTQNWHTIDTQADAASDDLDTITAAADVTDGYLLFVRANNAARTVVLKHNTGNIYCPGGADISLTDVFPVVCLMYDATLVKWVVQSDQYGRGDIDNRQGGSATVWATAGTNNYTPATWAMQAGSLAVSSGNNTLTFPVAFSQAPLIFPTGVGGDVSLAAASATATNCVLVADATATAVNWIAIGPP